MASRLGSPNTDRKVLHALIDKVGNELIEIKASGQRRTKKMNRYEALIRAGFEAATGIFKEENLDGKKMIVFQTAPDAAAFRQVIEQRFGRAPQQIDVKNDSLPVPPTFLIPQFEKNLSIVVNHGNGENGDGQKKSKG